MLKRSLFKFLLCLAVVFNVGGFLTHPVFAQSTPNAFLDKQSAMKQGSGLEAWTNESMGNNMMSLYNGMVGDIPDSFFSTGTSATGLLQNYVPSGAFGTMNTMIASLNTPPASGIEYIAQVKDSFLGKPAYAQGVGFNGLQFLLPLWRGFRNVVYVLASIIFIAIGIMIMLRVKISPQAVITVQSAIPKLITTLILVTFSYAIAGLVIDLCNLVQALVVAVLFSVKGVNLNDNLFNSYWFGSGFPGLSDIGNAVGWLFNVVVSVFSSGSTNNSSFGFNHLSNPNLRDLQMLTYRAVPGWISLTMLGGLLGSIVVGFFLGGIGSAFLGSAGNAVTDVVGRFVGGVSGGLIGGLLIPIILCIIVGIWLIKLYFGLLKCYVTVIFKIVLAPLEIGMGAFPNAKIGFSSWLLDVVSNMAVFPVVGIFLVLLNMIIDAVAGSNGILGYVGSSAGIGNAPVWAPGLISSGGISPSIIAACIGLAGLAMLSKLPELVPQFIFMIKPSPFGQAIGESLGNKMPIVGSLASAGSQLAAETAVKEGPIWGLKQGKKAVARWGARRAPTDPPTTPPPTPQEDITVSHPE